MTQSRGNEWRTMMEEIRHKMYSGGKMHSLHFVGGGVNHECCVIVPGKYDFGKSKRTVTITCTFNSMIVNGVTIKPGSRPFVIRTGDQIKYSVEDVAIYHCIYR